MQLLQEALSSAFAYSFGSLELVKSCFHPWLRLGVSSGASAQVLVAVAVTKSGCSGFSLRGPLALAPP